MPSWYGPLRAGEFFYRHASNGRVVFTYVPAQKILQLRTVLFGESFIDDFVRLACVRPWGLADGEPGHDTPHRAERRAVTSWR